MLSCICVCIASFLPLFPRITRISLPLSPPIKMCKASNPCNILFFLCRFFICRMHNIIIHATGFVHWFDLPFSPFICYWYFLSLACLLKFQCRVLLPTSIRNELETQKKHKSTTDMEGETLNIRTGAPSHTKAHESCTHFTQNRVKNNWRERFRRDSSPNQRTLAGNKKQSLV